MRKIIIAAFIALTVSGLKAQDSEIQTLFSGSSRLSGFGGPKGKKFMHKAFKRLLSEISDKSMTEQAEILEKTMADWQGIIEQIDDMVIIGIRI